MIILYSIAEQHRFYNIKNKYESKRSIIPFFVYPTNTLQENGQDLVIPTKVSVGNKLIPSELDYFRWKLPSAIRSDIHWSGFSPSKIRLEGSISDRIIFDQYSVKNILVLTKLFPTKYSVEFNASTWRLPAQLVNLIFNKISVENGIFLRKY